MLAAARARARAIGQRAVSFIEADLAGLDDEAWLEPGFDAIIGRLILLHVPDAVALLHALVRHLRRGGVMVFSEPDLIRMGASFPAMPALEQLCDWAPQAHRSLGVDCQFGLRLQQLFRAAGLPAPNLKCDAFIGGGPDWGWYDQMIAAARNALPVVVSAGIITAGQADIDALAEQVRAEAASQHTVTRAIDLISAWSVRDR
jgi:SAM-dependent methyltransferase